MLLPPPSKRIVYNSTVDDSVWVHCPTGPVFFWMTHGGLWGNKPRGFFDEQVRRQVASGIPERAAARWIFALQYGGHTEAEAWSVIRDRNCHNPTGYAHELMEFSELPDRWFRGAWTRGHNGGPPTVDMHKARPIQWRKIVDAKTIENMRREQDLDDVLGSVRLDELSLKAAIRNARDEDELSRIWPDGLTPPKRSVALAASQALR